MKSADIQFKVDCSTPTVCKCKVIVPKAFIQNFFKHATALKQKEVMSSGFKQGGVPLNYIETHYKKDILNHSQEIFLKHFVLEYLFEQIHKNKLLIVGEIQLIDLEIDINKDTIYIFEGVMPKEVYIQRWKNLPFKATQRKKYRDIDNQVKTFIEQEEAQKKLHEKEDTIDIGDWVCFNSWIIDAKEKELFKGKKSNLWLKIGNEEPDVTFQDLFIGKKIGETFITANPSMRHYFCELFDAPYFYAIEIVDRLPYKYFSLPHLKHHFKIKTQKDLHNKLIEIFSFSSDISQRRSIADNALHTIIKRNNIVIPQASIEYHKDYLLHELAKKPDYNVYKMQSGFNDQIHQLAKKQIYETVVVDHIAYQENLNVEHEDIKAYLNLTQRKRTLEFLYFEKPKTRFEGQEFPVSSKALHRHCLREKSLNHIIHHLSK